MCIRQPYQWHTRCDEDVGRCHCIFMLFFFNLSSWTRWIPCSFKILQKKRTSMQRWCCLDDVVYVKTETKPFTQNANVSHFLEGHLSLLHSCLPKESRIFRNRFKIIVNSTLKKHVSKLYGRTSLPIPLHLVFLNEKPVNLCDWFSVLCIKLCIYMMLFVSNCLSNLIN